MQRFHIILILDKVIGNNIYMYLKNFGVTIEHYLNGLGRALKTVILRISLISSTSHRFRCSSCCKVERKVRVREG